MAFQVWSPGRGGGGGDGGGGGLFGGGSGADHVAHPVRDDNDEGDYSCPPTMGQLTFQKTRVTIPAPAATADATTNDDKPTVQSSPAAAASGREAPRQRRWGLGRRRQSRRSSSGGGGETDDDHSSPDDDDDTAPLASRWLRQGSSGRADNAGGDAMKHPPDSSEQSDKSEVIKHNEGGPDSADAPARSDVPSCEEGGGGDAVGSGTVVAAMGYNPTFTDDDGDMSSSVFVFSPNHLDRVDDEDYRDHGGDLKDTGHVGSAGDRSDQESGSDDDVDLSSESSSDGTDNSGEEEEDDSGEVDFNNDTKGQKQQDRCDEGLKGSGDSTAPTRRPPFWIPLGRRRSSGREDIARGGDFAMPKMEGIGGGGGGRGEHDRPGTVAPLGGLLTLLRRNVLVAGQNNRSDSNLSESERDELEEAYLRAMPVAASTEGGKNTMLSGLGGALAPMVQALAMSADGVGADFNGEDDLGEYRCVAIVEEAGDEAERTAADGSGGGGGEKDVSLSELLGQITELRDRVTKLETTVRHQDLLNICFQEKVRSLEGQLENLQRHDDDGIDSEYGIDTDTEANPTPGDDIHCDQRVSELIDLSN